jgi:hypothetical protein
MAAAVPDPVEQFRLILSYVEKVFREKEKWAKIVDSQPVKVTRFDTVAASYREHERTAAALHKDLLKPHQKQLPDLQSTLRKKHLQQKRLVTEVSQGKIKPQKANELNRDLAAEMIELQKAIHISQAIVNAQSAEDLGGLIELPIDEYAPRIDPNYGNRDREVDAGKNSINTRVLVQASAVLLTLVLLWVGWSHYTSLGKARFSVESPQGRSHALEIVCKNKGDKRIKVFAPWPGGITMASDREKFPRRSFGIQLYIKEKGKDIFRLLPASPGCWYRGGNSIAEGASVNIPGNRVRKIRFEPDGLADLGIEAAALRFVVTRHGGRRMMEYEVNLKR